MSGVRRGFVRDAFHQAAVAGNEIRVVIDYRETIAIKLCSEVRFGDRKANGVGHTLSKWSRGRFDTNGVMHFGMSRCLAAPLPEVFDLAERKIIA